MLIWSVRIEKQRSIVTIKGSRREYSIGIVGQAEVRVDDILLPEGLSREDVPSVEAESGSWFRLQMSHLKGSFIAKYMRRADSQSIGAAHRHLAI